jgi:hypothetical protein
MTAEVASASPFSAADGPNPDDDADEIVDLDPIARLHAVILDGLGSDSGDVNLTLGIVHVSEVDVPRDLAVDADRLNPLEDPVPGALEHVDPYRAGRRLRAAAHRHG